MPDEDIIALSKFTYGTRRLKAGDRFTVPARMAKVLVGIRMAQRPREAGQVGAPPAALVQKVMEADAPKKPRPQLDHDGDGRPGGSPRGAISTASKGRKRKGAKKA